MVGPISRRNLLKNGALSLFFGVAVASLVGRAAAADKACADPDKLDSGATALRGSLNYVEAGTDPAKTCAACGFFAATAGGCGSCQIFNGPVNSKGHCDSWSAKS
jgi:hypothetical protein